MYPTGAGSPKFYGLPDIHKPAIPLRPIVSGIGTVTYSTAKELAKIMKPLVGMSEHHVHNTKDFVEHLNSVVISTLFHRAKDVCSTKEQLEEEHTHIQKVLTSCKYPSWAVNRMKMKT